MVRSQTRPRMTPLPLAVALAILEDVEATLREHPDMDAPAILALWRTRARVQVWARISSRAGRYGPLGQAQESQR